MSVVTWALFALLVVYITIPILLYLLAPKDLPLDRKKTAVVIVLGDLGHSPRINYHALSIAKCGYQVELCGYLQSKLMNEIIDNKSININDIQVVNNKYNLPFILFGPLKVIYQHWILVKLLKKFKGADYLLIQNPPSIPILGVVRFFSLFISPRTRVIIDWHNLGYSILSLKFENQNHPFIKIYKWYERFFGYRAYVHLTVTIALGQYLRNEFDMNGKRIIPLYDRPANQFKLISESEKKEIIEKYNVKGNLLENFDSKNEKIIVTSTSYTPDEDLYILLESLEEYSKIAKDKPDLPSLRVIITGKGPMLEEIKQQIIKLTPKFNNKVSIHTVWLPIEEYPKVLGIADLGISLHQSSSGWDLPMKIIDMFGCGVPVISISFPAISELIKQNENGLIVETSSEMTKSLIKLFTTPSVLNNLKRGAVRESRIKWDTNWTEKLGPLFGVGQYRQLAPGEDSSSSSSDDE